MVGSGVCADNIEHLLLEVPATQWHASASRAVASNARCLWGDSNANRRCTDAQMVFSLKSALRRAEHKQQ